MDPAAASNPTFADAVHDDMARMWESVAAGWARWEPSLVSAFAPVTQQMLSAARLAPGQRVLDVGSGIGEPALAAARAVGAEGAVTAVDLSAGMLAILSDRARVLGMTQVTCRVGAVENLDLPAAHFDVVLAQFSIMFMPDPTAGLAQLGKSLRVGGRIVVAVWTPPAMNEGFAFPSRVVREITDVPKTDRAAPGPFRLSGPGELADALQAGGFEDVQVLDVPIYLFARDAEAYWDMLCSVSDSFRRLWTQLDEPTRVRVRQRMIQAVEAYRSGTVLRLPACARVGWGVKPGN